MITFDGVSVENLWFVHVKSVDHNISSFGSPPFRCMAPSGIFAVITLPKYSTRIAIFGIKSFLMTTKPRSDKVQANMEHPITDPKAPKR
jgi:hypothetical protein